MYVIMYVIMWKFKAHWNPTLTQARKGQSQVWITTSDELTFDTGTLSLQMLDEK